MYMKPKYHWRLQDIGDAKTYPIQRTVGKKWSQPKREGMNAMVYWLDLCINLT